MVTYPMSRSERRRSAAMCVSAGASTGTANVAWMAFTIRLPARSHPTQTVSSCTSRSVSASCGRSQIRPKNSASHSMGRWIARTKRTIRVARLGEARVAIGLFDAPEQGAEQLRTPTPPGEEQRQHEDPRDQDRDHVTERRIERAARLADRCEPRRGHGAVVAEDEQQVTQLCARLLDADGGKALSHPLILLTVANRSLRAVILCLQ